MWFASIWIFTLKLPWVLGADFFQRYLLDADPASNTCSWRWVAGLHTQGKTYLARPDNIAQFTGGRYGSITGLATEAPALTEAALPPTVPPVFASHDLSGRMGILITEADCHPESVAWPTAPSAVLALSEPCPRSPSPLGELPSAFTHAAVLDAADRAEHHFACDVTRHGHADWSLAVVAWAKAQDLDCLAVAQPAIGPVNDQLRTVHEAIRDIGVSLAMITRPHDRLVWPHSDRGYFRVRKQIPALLDALEIALRQG